MKNYAMFGLPQRTKAPTTASPSCMLTPSFPRAPLQDLAIDFVGPLKLSGSYNMLLTCTCRLLGFTRITPCLQKDTAEKTATRLFSGWFGLFGAPKSILGDRDKIWSSKFWKCLMAKLGTVFHMTFSFHPQADGRSKWTNKTVSQILRMFTAKRQTRWLEALPAVEFAINSAINVSTGFTPFELIFGRKPSLFPSSAKALDSPPSLAAWLKKREGSWQTARDNLINSRIHQALQHNCHQRPHQTIEANSWVLLNLADWQGRHQGGTDKLKERYEGPYRVTYVFNKGQSVVLDLPDGDKRHSTLHISKVKPYFMEGDGALEEPQK
jgi:hypothetical protein